MKNEINSQDFYIREANIEESPTLGDFMKLQGLETENKEID